MSESLKKQYRNMLVWFFILLFITRFLPVSAVSNIMSDITSASDVAELTRQELNENRTELKQELENEGYEVSDENLERYINTFVTSYQNGLEYVVKNQARLISAMQDAAAAGHSTSELEKLNEKLINQMLMESGFDPKKIAQNIFPLKSASSTKKEQTTPNIEAPKTPAPTPEIVESKPASTQNTEKHTSYFVPTDDSIFNSMSNYIRSWAFDKKRASDTRKKIFDSDASASTASDIIINLTSKVADTVGSVGVAAVDAYYDFIDNLADGDGVILGGSKSLIANTANGLAGIFIGSADIITYTFSRIPAVRKQFPNLPERLDFGKNIKGPINFVIDNVFNGRNVADMRAVSGAYGINMKDSFKNRKSIPAMPPRHEIISHNQKYNQTKDYGVNIVRY